MSRRESKTRCLTNFRRLVSLCLLFSFCQLLQTGTDFEAHKYTPVSTRDESITLQTECRRFPYLHVRDQNDVEHFNNWLKSVWVRAGSLRISLEVRKNVAMTFTNDDGPLFSPRTLSNEDECDMTIYGHAFAFREWWVDAPSHFLFDHLPVIAWLRSIMREGSMGGEDGVLILDDIEANKRFMNYFDDDFAQSIIWIKEGQTVCTSSELIYPIYREDQVMERQQEKLLPGTWIRGSIEGRPPFGAIRLPAFVDLLREWISERAPVLISNPQPVVLYYVRGNWSNGRQMEVYQDSILVERLRKKLLDCGRKEKVVIFTGRNENGTTSLTLEEQFVLFHSATMFVGPHGGGAANIIFMKARDIKTGSMCRCRPQVIEFVPGVRSGHVHWAFASYYDHYYGPSWVEYHMLQFETNSTGALTSIDLYEWDIMIRAVFADHRCGSLNRMC